MSKIKEDGPTTAKIGGIYTRNAIESFENNILSQTNYLEKVEKDSKNSKK